ncbi:MAG: hypothetical protein ACUVX9_05855 [Anaerolineae bacterium]
MQERIRPTHVGIEWGSGRSTVWLAKRAARLISVEHSSEWHARVQAWLTKEALLNVDYRLCPVSPGRSSYRAEEVAYVGVVTALPDESLDFALIDGRFRARCALAALRKLCPGGMLIVDNANHYLPSASRAPRSIAIDGVPPNKEWALFRRRVARWRCLWTSNGVFDTAIWFKPQVCVCGQPSKPECPEGSDPSRLRE